jgi:rhodanese-related sulfurtransferase
METPDTSHRRGSRRAAAGSDAAGVGGLVAVAIAAAVASQAVAPRRIPWRGDWEHDAEARAVKAGARVVDLPTAAALAGSNGVLVLDARPRADYEAGHIAGARSVPPEELAGGIPQTLLTVPAEQAILTYCAGEACDESLRLIRLLMELRRTNVHVYVGGYRQWEAARRPVRTGAEP